MKLRKIKTRRSDTKVMSKEAQLLKYLRESRSLSMRKAASIMGVSEATVNHSENGRKDLTDELIKRFLKIYGYSKEEFKRMLKGEVEVPEHLRSECIEIIRRLEVSKLKTIKSILMTF